MVVWQGITAEGVAVPVQVNDQGQVIAKGLEGEPGEPGEPGPPGPPGPPGDPATGGGVQQGDNVTFGTGNFTGNVNIGSVDEVSPGSIQLRTSGRMRVIRDSEDEYETIVVLNNSLAGNNTRLVMTNYGNMRADGFVDCAKGKAGFTEDGSLYFTERGETWKLIPSSNGLVTCEQVDPIKRFPLLDSDSAESS